MIAPVYASRTGEWSARTALTIAWLAAVFVVRPAGDFPLNDDWSYAHAVLSLVQDHAWKLTDFTSMPLATQLLWGALFCVPRGFSFEALRASTLVLGWIGGLGAYQLVRDAGSSRPLAVVAASTLLLCPVYFGLAFSFMTDVPFAALAIWSAVFTVRYAHTHHLRDLIVAIALVTAATLVRQLGAVLAVSAAVGLLVAAPRRMRSTGAAVTMAVLPMAALLAYNALLSRLGEPWYYYRREAEWLVLLANTNVLTRTVGTRLLQAAVTLGLFLTPAVIVFRVAPATRRGRLLFAIGAAGLGVILLLRRHAIPLVGNILFDAGLSPVIIDGAASWPTFPRGLWIVVTIVAVLSAAAVLARAAEMLRHHVERRTQGASATIVLVAVMLAGSTAPLLMTNFFDRYLLLPLALALACLPALGRETRGAVVGVSALAVLGAFAIFDVAALHDTFAFNRARWAAVEWVESRGVAPEQIDGGFEVNGWLSYRPDRPYRDSGPWWGPKPRPSVRLSLTERPKFRTIATFAFERWLVPGAGAVYVLEPELL